MSSYPYLLHQSLDVDTCSEVETPSDLGGRLIGQRRNVNAVCALPRCSHEEKSSGSLRRSFLPVSKSIKPTEVRNFPDQRYRDAAVFEDTRFLSICTNRRTFLFVILTALQYDGIEEILGNTTLYNVTRIYRKIDFMTLNVIKSSLVKSIFNA